MECKKCNSQKSDSEFYKNDKTCKVCRREMVRKNRELKVDYYRDYDKKRFQDDPKVKERHKKYLETDAGKASASKAKKKYIEKNPIKRASHIMVGNAIRDGKINVHPCSVCGTSLNVHAHHDDYSKPLEVTWLCAKHHKEWHKENGEGLNAI